MKFYKRPDTNLDTHGTKIGVRLMVGVSGFEPEASWSRTKRDTKLRHTPKAKILYAFIFDLSSPKV